MNNKDIRRQRMITYFIDAAKEIIMTEGIKSVTARRIGEKAGYSYATIYNYFDDLNTLLAFCVFDFFEDCYEYVISFKDDNKDSLEQLITYATAYFKYFAEHPDLFYLIFIEDLGTVPEEFIRTNKTPSISLLLKDVLEKCVSEGYITDKNIYFTGELISSSLQGYLMLYVTGRNDKPLDNIIDLIEKEIKFLTGKGGKCE